MSTTRRALLAVSVTLLWGGQVLLTGSASALRNPREWRANPHLAASDSIPPQRPTLLGYTVHRGAQYHEGPGGSVLSYENPWEGVIRFTLAGGDDRTPDPDLGYRIRVLGGIVPRALQQPVGPVWGWHATDSTGVARSHGVALTWRDEPPFNTEPFKFAVTITCLDRAGNASAESDTIIVTHLGHD